jgi:integrase
MEIAGGRRDRLRRAGASERAQPPIPRLSTGTLAMLHGISKPPVVALTVTASHRPGACVPLRASHPAASVSAMARVLAFAADRGEIDTNILDKVTRVYRSDRSEKIWCSKDLAAFIDVAPKELAAALMLALHTGQRQGDLLRLAWSAYDGKAISLRQSKTGRLVTVPCTTELRNLLDSMKRHSVVMLTTPTGRPWTAYNFRHKWAAVTKAAGIVDLHFHDLRGTAVTMLAEAGATVPEIATITGHGLEHVSRILERYLARTRHLSESAMLKFENRLQDLQSRT